MVKSNLKEQKVIKKADLKVVDNNAVKTTAYSDINLKKWREYDHIKTDTLWEFPNRLKEGGHSNEYHGNYIPQIAQQIYERYTKKNDIVLDLFFGSGTSGIEAINMGRRCIGVELKDELAESVSEKFTPKQLVTDVNIICADSASEIAKEKIKARLDIMGAKKAQLLMLHPPYDDIIKFSDKKEDLSKHISNINCQKEKEEKSISEYSNKYIEYIQSLNHQKKSSSKNFYIILKYKNDDKKIKTVDDLAIENLNDKYFKIKDCLSRCGNGVIDINNINDSKNVLFSFLNSRIYLNN